MQDVKIYICCHKDYEDVGITNPCYRLISDKDIKNDTKLEFVKSDGFLDNRLWSELSHIYYVWKHPELQADWVGFCHYRRYFDFMNDIPEFTVPIVAEPIASKYNNFISYFINHNAEDLLYTILLAYKKKPEYFKYMMKFCDMHSYLPYNMFIFPKELFNDLCDYLFNILFMYDKYIDVGNDYSNMLKHIGNNRELYIEKAIKDGMPNNNYEYQARLYGFLSERLFSVYMLKYINDFGKDSILNYKVRITEKTYNYIKEDEKG